MVKQLAGRSELRKAAALALGTGLALLLTTFAAPARAATWSERQVGEAQLFAMSCPTESECVAAGTNNIVITSRNPTGGAGEWNRIDLDAVAIPPGAGTAPFRQIRGVACPSPSLCVAVNLEGQALTSRDPTGGPGAWSVADLSPTGPNHHLYGVSCPSPSLCVAAASKGEIVTSTDPTGGAGAWTVTQLAEPLELRGVSCPTASLCVAVGLEGQIVSSTNPLGGTTAWSRTQLAGAPIDRSLLGVSCPSPKLCVSGNAAGAIVTAVAPTGPASAWASAQGGGTVQITAVDCPSESQCVAIDNNGDVLTSTNPTGGASAWTFENLLPFAGADDNQTGNGTFGVSCASASLCAIDGAMGRIFVSTNPFEPPPAAPVKKPGSKQGRKHKGPKFPRALIGARPPIGTEIRGRKTKVRFRFFAAHHASVRGYVCQIDHRPMRPCRSPKGYRVGVGIHFFKVRAVGWTGRRGPVAGDGFKVCHPTRLGLCIGAFSKGHSQGQEAAAG
jgi:hypothetical protein